MIGAWGGKRWCGWPGLVTLGVSPVGAAPVAVRRDEALGGGQAMAEQGALGFGGLVRQLRAEAGLT